MLPDSETRVICTICGGTGKVQREKYNAVLEGTMKDVKEAVVRKNLMDDIMTKCYKLSTREMANVNEFIDVINGKDLF
jgi:hypothetical protein